MIINIYFSLTNYPQTTSQDIINVDLAVGITGTMEDWTKNVAETNNILSHPVQTANSFSKTIESSLITMVLKTDTAVMANSLTSQYHIEVDDLVTIHFLDPTKYETIKLMLTAGTAYASHTNTAGHLQIDVSQYVQSTCAAGTDG
jgi:hypothetical protein